MYSKGSVSASRGYLTPEQFGADPDGKRSSSNAFARMFEKAMQEDLLCKCDRPGRYRLDRSVKVSCEGRRVRFEGSGRQLTHILLDGDFTGLSIKGVQGRENEVHLSNFSISRLRYELYQGPIGKRAIEVSEANGVIIEGIEESGGIGFGIFLDRCLEYRVSDCIIRDHIGGRIHRSGTDGLHIYRSPGPGRVFNNTVFNVGDDAISFGSFAIAEPTAEFSCFSNTISDTAGSIKVYGNSKRFHIYENRIVRPKTGGVVVWDDRGHKESFVISDGVIAHNTVSNQIGAGICGAISVWSPAGSGAGFQRNIHIENNIILNCNFGVTVASQVSNKYNENIVIVGNNIFGARQRGIMLDGYGGSVVVSRNVIKESGFEAIYLGKVSPRAQHLNLLLSENTIGKFGLVDRKRPAVAVKDKRWKLSDNQIDGPAAGWFSGD